MTEYLRAYRDKYVKAAPLAVFRLVFGLLMFISIIRFWLHGWIEELYLHPKVHFHYLGFEFIQVPGKWTYALFVLCGLSALFVAIGYRYRLSIVLFFLSFTYIELMDKTTYLNHYYFISVLSFLMIWLPAGSFFSVDALRNPKAVNEYVPRWCIDAVKVLLAIVYISAGLAKLNADWLLRAMPLAIWLPAKADIPLLGTILHETWIHYFMSWAGALYDLFIVIFLLWRKTRPAAFLVVVIFHVLTRVLFPIGMFPFIMIGATLIFFSGEFHENLLKKISSVFRLPDLFSKSGNEKQYQKPFVQKLAVSVMLLLIVIQVAIPLRSYAYPGNLFWTEQGYRFSWRVMLMEKTGSATFRIVDGETGRWFYVQNEDFLTPLQQKQMSTQPDFIVEYAHFLGKHFAKQGHKNVEVYVDSYVALNGRRHQQFIDPATDLMKIRNSLNHKDFILPFREHNE